MDGQTQIRLAWLEFHFHPFMHKGFVAQEVGGWHLEVLGRLLAAAKKCRFLPVGIESSSVPSASSADLKNKAMIIRGQKTWDFDDVAGEELTSKLQAEWSLIFLDAIKGTVFSDILMIF